MRRWWRLGGIVVVLAAGVVFSDGDGKPLSGRVLTETGTPVAGARVSVLVQKWRSIETDEKGNFRFEGVPPEEHTLRVQKAGLLEVRTRGRGGQTVELHMSAAAVLSGLARTSSGELVLEYSLRARALDGGDWDQHDVATRSVDGGFAVEVWPGDYELLVQAPRLSPTRLKTSAPGRDVVVVMYPGAAIRGVVLNHDGKPAAGAQVSATRGGPSPASSRQVSTDLQGRFELSGVDPGEWTVDAMLIEEGGLLTARASTRVLLAEPGMAEVVLEPKPGVPFAGVVVSAEGEPTPGVVVFAEQLLSDGGFDSWFSLSARTDDRGRFRLRSLPAGPVRLIARGREASSEARQVSNAPNEKVVLRFSGKAEGDVLVTDARTKKPIKGERASVLIVKVVDASGAAAEGASVVAWRDAGPRVQLRAAVPGPGVFESRGLAPGAWRVQAHTTDGRTFRPAEVILGDKPAELVLREAPVSLKPPPRGAGTRNAR